MLHSAGHGARARVAGTLLLATAVAACSIPPFTAPGPSSTRSPSVDPALAAARAAFFANKYAEAEKDYQQLLITAPGEADVHAAYALFLNYSHRFSEALSQIHIAVGLDPNNALVGAIDTRVHDWVAGSDHQQLKQAADLGSVAVKLGPRSALTHAFYGEALADTGDISHARVEIDTAATLANGAFEKAEVERERANLAGDTGDHDGALTHFTAARDLQPGWAERTKELAGYFFQAGQVEQGITHLKQAIAMAPGDANLRLYLGGVALGKQNVPVAAEALGAANDLKPHDASVESTLAMALFTLHHDVGEAEKLLRQATADAPNNFQVADLLDGFLRFIKHDPTTADQVKVGLLPREPLNPLATFPVSVSFNRRVANEAALKAVNDFRAKAHLPPVHLDDRITAGAESHSYWWLFNLSLPAVKGLGIHHEVAGTPGFTGVVMRDRAVHFGFPVNVSMAEVIDHEGTPKSAVEVWVDSVYHRFPLMRPDLEAVGFGEGIGGGLPIETMDLSFRSDPGDPGAVIPYPGDGQTGVPPLFTGNELPDPVPGGYKSPTGFPITVNFNPAVSVSLGGITLRGPSGADIPFYTLPPQVSDENVLTILPKEPLSPRTTYRVHVSGSIQGNSFSRDWSFTTES